MLNSRHTLDEQLGYSDETEDVGREHGLNVLWVNVTDVVDTLNISGVVH